MGEKFCKIAAESGVNGLILFPLAGPSAVTSFVGSAIKNNIVPLVGGDLPIEDYTKSGGGYVVDEALGDIFARSIVSAQNILSFLVRHRKRCVVIL